MSAHTVQWSWLCKSSCSSGAFIGPSVAGLLMDFYDVPRATLFVSVFAASLMVVNGVDSVTKSIRERRRRGYEQLHGEERDKQEVRAHRVCKK